MKNKDNNCSTYETAYLLSITHGLIRLIAIITTFFFWFCLLALISLTLHLNLVSLDQLFGWNLVLQIVGLSPVALTVFSWRTVEKIFAYFLQWYADNHTATKDS